MCWQLVISLFFVLVPCPYTIVDKFTGFALLGWTSIGARLFGMGSLLGFGLEVNM